MCHDSVGTSPALSKQTFTNRSPLLWSHHWQSRVSVKIIFCLSPDWSGGGGGVIWLWGQEQFNWSALIWPAVVLKSTTACFGPFDQQWNCFLWCQGLMIHVMFWCSCNTSPPLPMLGEDQGVTFTPGWELASIYHQGLTKVCPRSNRSLVWQLACGSEVDYSVFWPID
jgi:hypothetical protein